MNLTWQTQICTIFYKEISFTFTSRVNSDKTGDFFDIEMTVNKALITWIHPESKTNIHKLNKLKDIHKKNRLNDVS